jgi:hypothetical protein
MPSSAAIFAFDLPPAIRSMMYHEIAHRAGQAIADWVRAQTVTLPLNWAVGLSHSIAAL